MMSWANDSPARQPGDTDMARGFSRAPSASVELLDAARRGLHRTHIAFLAQSRNRTVRETIARRSDVPLGVQAALAQDAATEVRSAIAGNAHTVRSVLDYLSSDKSQAVLTSLLANPSIPFEIVDGLALHRRAEVRRLAAARLRDETRLPRVDDPRDEDAMFPELRERAAAMAVAVEAAPSVVAVEAAPSAVAVEAPPFATATREFAVVDMETRRLIPPWATSPALVPSQGAAMEPAYRRTTPVYGLRVSAAS